MYSPVLARTHNGRKNRHPATPAPVPAWPRDVYCRWVPSRNPAIARGSREMDGAAGESGQVEWGPEL